MIAKFNFYDIYGYFLPGLVLLFLSGLPFGIVCDRWPSGELVTALIGIPLAYVAGHILQAFAVRVFPSTTDHGRFHRMWFWIGRIRFSHPNSRPSSPPR